jgi:hypothetical protein
VNETDVYIIGGNNLFKSLLKHDYDAPKSCLLLNNTTGLLTQKSPMHTGRSAHSLCHIGQKIYVIGGADMFVEGYRGWEIYDTLRDKWSVGEGGLPHGYSVGITV